MITAIDLKNYRSGYLTLSYKSLYVIYNQSHSDIIYLNEQKQNLRCYFIFKDHL
jgi:hypothetical protein